MFAWLDLPDLLKRAINTIAQTAIALLGVGAIDVLKVDWKSLALASLVAGLLSALQSLVRQSAVDRNGGS